MPRPRKTLVYPETTPYYHCVSRCVRRAFLCGKDPLTGRNLEHRRAWIEERLLELAGIFAIDIAAYAVMHNHYHVVLYINHDKADNWSDTEVINRWHALFKGNILSQRFAQGENLNKAEHSILNKQIHNWRERLASISWFMRCANEPVARAANKEDNATGRFWEGRFKSHALLDEKALIACMAYVDLNPIRTRLAQTPEESEHTSIKKRIETTVHSKQPNQQADNIQPLTGNPRNSISEGLPFHLTDYLELVDWTGRIIREDKRGYIPDNMPDILQRLNLDTKHWLYLSEHFESPFKHLVGAAHSVRQACEETGRQWAQGIRQCERLFSST